MQAKRPVWVWVITIYKSIGFAFVFLSIALIYSHAIPLAAAADSAMQHIRPIDWVVSALVTVLGIIATWLLFTLRKPAPFFLTAALAINIAYAVLLMVFNKNAPAASIATFIGWGVEGAICVYAWTLLRKGVLGDQTKSTADVFG